MRRIAIVGGGQSGLHLAIGLLRHGYEVTIQTDRTADEVRTGRVLSTQGMQHPALELERAVGLDLWDDAAPQHRSFLYSTGAADGTRLVNWRLARPHHGNSVCQRIKIPGWMEMFQSLGGQLIIEPADINSLENLARENELVLVATGKGDIGTLFERDPRHSPYDRPQRTLVLCYFAGASDKEGYGVSFNVVPGVGEYFVMPGLTTTGSCDMGLLEAIPGGPMDHWDDIESPDQHLERFKEALEQYFPWEHGYVRDKELTDEMGVAVGRLTPAVRKPVGTLPSGTHVMGLGDVVMLNDPLTGQGSNHAAKAAAHYLAYILEREMKPFDQAWMGQLFDTFLDVTGAGTARYANAMLDPTPHVLELFAAAETDRNLAERICKAQGHPPDFDPWFYDEDSASI